MPGPRPRLAALVAASLVALASLAACGESDVGLGPLRADPMASVAVPGTEAGTTVESAADDSLGQPTQATLDRRLPLSQGADPQAVLAAAVALAEANGWRGSGAPISPGGAWLFTKVVDGDLLELGLHISDVDGRPTLVVGLRNLTAVAMGPPVAP